MTYIIAPLRGGSHDARMRHMNTYRSHCILPRHMYVVFIAQCEDTGANIKGERAVSRNQISTDKISNAFITSNLTNLPLINYINALSLLRDQMLDTLFHSIIINKNWV